MKKSTSIIVIDTHEAETAVTQPCNCMILNPFTRTLKQAAIPHTLENWYAVIGTVQVEQFSMQDGEGTSCLYADDFYDRYGVETQYGTKFQGWMAHITGILIFIGPPDEEGYVTSITNKAMMLLEEEFK